MSLEKIRGLSDSQVLSLYGRVKLNLMLSKLFKEEQPPPEVFAFKDEISRQISERGLDRDNRNKTR